MTDLKPGMKGRWHNWRGEIFGVYLTWAWFVEEGFAPGAGFIINADSFTPDPPPPSTVMVEMTIEDAGEWSDAGKAIVARSWRRDRLADACREALTKAGLA